MSLFEAVCACLKCGFLRNSQFPLQLTCAACYVPVTQKDHSFLQLSFYKDLLQHHLSIPASVASHSLPVNYLSPSLPGTQES